jgi:hypothetical protein
MRLRVTSSLNGPSKEQQTDRFIPLDIAVVEGEAVEAFRELTVPAAEAWLDICSVVCIVDTPSSTVDVNLSPLVK